MILGYNSLLTLFLAPLIFFSCTNNNGQTEDGEFTVIDYSVKEDQVGFKKVPYGSVYAIEYVVTGTVKNNTKNIVKDGLFEIRIVLKLENGNEIKNQQINPTPMMFDSYQDIIKGQFLPNDEKKFSLSSLRLTKEYGAYPLQKFYVQYVLVGTDPLKNDERFEEVIEQKDVTEEWKKFVKDFNEKEE